jgi:hypothetical protein
MIPSTSLTARLTRALVVGGLLWLSPLASDAAAQKPTHADSVAAKAKRDTVEAKAKTDTARVKTAEGFAVPESPAFTFLNFAPATVTRPNTPRDFVAALANGIDETGHVRQGISLEVTPAYLIPGLGVGLTEYQNSFFKRLLSNAQLSLATVRASGDTAATDLGFGLRLTVLDNGDPMKDPLFTSQLGAALLGCHSEPPDFKPALVCLGANADKLRLPYLKSHWNSTRLTVAFATGLRFDQSQVSETSALGWNGWAALTAPLGTAGQMIGYFAFTHRPEVSGVPKFSSVDFGGRVLVGSPTFNAFAEVVGNSKFDTPVTTDKSTAAWSGGIEFKAAENLWLSTGFGTRFGDTAEPNRVIVLGNLRWGVSSKQRLASAGS